MFKWILSAIKKNCNSEMGNTIKSLLLTEDKFSSSLIDQPKKELIPNSNGKFIVYSLLCNKNARYIGMTKNLTETLQSHENGTKCWFTKIYKPINIEEQKYYDKEINAKMAQIDLLDELKYNYGNSTKVYTEFVNSKPDLGVVWEDIILPADEELFENTPNNPSISYWVYVLICEESKYYVGFTNNLRNRFIEHSSGIRGSCFTYQYPPLAVFHIEGHENLASAKKAEMNWTLDLKKLKGKNNVGGFWSKSNDPSVREHYRGHELLENWEIKNPKAFDIDKFD